MAKGIKAKLEKVLTVTDIQKKDGKNGSYRIVDFATLGAGLSLFVFDDKLKLEEGKEYLVEVRIDGRNVNFENAVEVKG